MQTILVTGAAGFIGSNLVLELLRSMSPVQIIGLDNMNDYYDVSIKEYRLEQIAASAAEHSDSQWTFIKGNLADKVLIDKIFADYKPEIVVNLAAQAGVRYSITNPDAYIESNLIGFYNILEACRHSYDNGAKGVEHLVYASSSSVYGSNKKVPYSTDDKVDNPVSLYAATKKSNELLAHSYSHLYRIPSTGLRFFTVYGPMGRPDMAYFNFTQKYFAGEPVRIFNNGDFARDLYRDFTYIDDIIEGMYKLLFCPPTGKSQAPYRIFNIGANRPEKLMAFIETLEQCLSRATGWPVVFDKIFEPLKPGDVPATYAATDWLEEAVGFRPAIPIAEGLQKFADWYVSYYQVNK